jgi:hypothetical protein
MIKTGLLAFILIGCFRHATKVGNIQRDSALQDTSASSRPFGRDSSKASIQRVSANKDTSRTILADSLRQRRDTVQVAGANMIHDSLSAKRSSDTLSLGSKKDTTMARLDSAKVKSDSVCLDSLKLSKWLPGLKHDNPQSQIFSESQYPLFLYSNVIQRNAVFDSTGDWVNIRETLWGKDVKIPIQVPLKEYVKLEQNYFTQRTWEDLAHAYVSKAGADQLGALMSGITNIDIPIPANPVLSIFGPPRINLKISGAVDVHGAWRNQKTDQQTTSALGNVTNQPDFKQDVQINVDGTVGDKLGIGANWDTQNQFDYENQLHIKYTGYNDEIIKSVEAGNVSMSTNSSFIGSSQALFGIKATAQFGPLTLTGLASQQKAQGKTMTYSGGSSAQAFSLPASQFSTNHFFIDTNYISEYQDYYMSSRIKIDKPNLVVTECEVYESVTNPAGNPNVRSCVAVMDLKPLESDATDYQKLQNKSINNPVPPDPGNVEYGLFIQLDHSQYTLDPNIGILTLNTNYSAEQIIAVVYKTNAGNTYGTFAYADTSLSDRLVLKLIKPQNALQSGGSYAEAWRLMLRNIYPLGGLNLSATSIKNLQMLYTAPGGTAQDNINQVNLLHLFHIDGTGTQGSQNTFYYNENVDVDPARGEIIFPFVKPFVDAFNQGGALAVPDSFAYESIYDTNNSDYYTSDIHNRFMISGSYTSSSSSRINLGFNLVQGSVKVLLNGSPLTADQGYTVDYITGDLTIKDPSALVTGANVQIQYETNDLVSIASKSLTGLEGDLKVSDQTSFGFTVMNYNIQSPNDKVQVGEEPMSNTILGIDGQTSVDLPFLTKALDALPLIQTAAPSKLSLHGEGAYMLPTPNTRTSPIPDDNGQGVAYIDDFEGAKRTIPLSISYSAWSIASPPENTAIDSVLNRQVPDSTKNNYRGWTYWYNITPSTTMSRDIWPSKEVASDQQTVTVLDAGFLDYVRGQYNRSRNIGATLDTNDTNPNLAKLAWGGFMCDLSSNASDLVSQNINYLEIWMKIDSSVRSTGTMHVDIGQISEDVFGDGVFRSEDTTGLGVRDNDFGIDQLSDDSERTKFPWIAENPDRPWWDPKNPDPDGDDYFVDVAKGDYFRVNGTENNASSISGLQPDGEDLNHNRFLDQTNSYYEYDIKLDTINNKYIAGGGSKGWYQYIIPLKDTSKIIGSPSLSVVQSVRFWFDGTTGPMLVHIAEMNLVGNYWRTPNVKDTTMQASVVDVFDNPGYDPPCAGLQPIDHSNPTQSIALNEQSLDLILNGLHGGDSRYVFKNNPAVLNLFHYKYLKFFVHSDPNFRYTDSTDHDAEVYIRFGGDSLNFYEYRQPLRYVSQPPLNAGWQDIIISFADLTAIKQGRDSVNQNVSHDPTGNGIPGSTYWLQGNPSLMNVSYFQIGIRNSRPGSALILRGSVWIDELRLTDADNTPGGAYRFDANLQLADFGSLGFNFSKTDPYFHGLTTQFGSLNTQQNWGLNASVSLERLLPREWQGTTIPFSYSHSESYSNPLYLAGSDILVTEAVAKRAAHYDSLGYSPGVAAAMADSLRVSSQVLRVQDSWSIPTMRLGIPSTKWYVKDILDDITMGYSWSGSRYRDTQVKTGNTWTWNFSSGYSVQFDPTAWYTPFPSKGKPNPGNAPASNQTTFNPTPENPAATPPPQTTTPAAPLGQDFRIRYLPNSLSLSMSATRSLTSVQYWTQNLSINPTFSSQRSGGFNWQLTNNGLLNPTIDYRFSVNSSLYTIDVDTLGLSAGKPVIPRPNSYVFSQIFFNNGFINFGTDYSFSQQFSLTTQPRLPFNLQQYFDLQGSYNSAYSWTNSLQQGEYGRGSGVSSTLTLGSAVRLKLLTDPWFGGSSTAGNAAEATAPTAPPPGGAPRTRGQGRAEFSAPGDTMSTAMTSSRGNPMGNLANIMIKVPFLNFENISVNFSSANSSQNGGLPSLRPGMGNFFRVPFIQGSDPALGPSQLYQLGLISDPYSKLVLFGKKSFPFFGFGMSQTTRIASPDSTQTLINDNYSNTNSVDIKTSRNLWQGARIDLSWHVGWSYTRNISFETNSYGAVDSIFSSTISGQVSRSFLTIPPFSVFSAFKSGISQVAADYETALNDPNDTRTNQEKISDAFVKGFETLPILDKIFGQYMPRMNYSFSWDGLEQLPLFKSFATHVSFTHAYQSTYSENWHNTNGSGQVTDAQTLSYGFQPLAGLNIAFKSIGDATISGSILYNTSTQYSLNPTTSSIAQQYTGQLTITADYAKKGFSLPLFGLNLQNDVDISASFSQAASTSSSFSMDAFTPGGTPISGTTQNSLEIRFRYEVSQRVTASIYYRNTRIIPTIPASLTPGSTTNEAGVDVHVSIAG